MFSFLSTAESLFHVALIILEYTAALIFGTRPNAPLADWILIVSTVTVASITSGYINYTVRKIAITDPLTSLSNRKGWDLAAPREISRAIRNQEFILLAMMDLDAFKEINDTDGHQVGDKILIETAMALLQSVRPFDVVTRWGGDEFIFLGLLSEPSDAKSLIERLVTNVQKVSSTSCGAVIATPDKQLEDMISAADKALYEAKRNSEKRYQFVEM